MALSIEQLDFRYGRLQVLRDINVEAKPARITAVLGPNAAGKSTLLRCMIGALRPQRGRVLVDGTSIAERSPRSLAQCIAYVPQRSTVSAAFTVRQVVELGRYALPMNAQRITRAIGEFDLLPIEQRPYPALSAGQQQRVMLARAFAQLGEHGHLILDEPTSAMDLRHVSECMELLQNRARNGATVVLALHDLSLAAAVADDVWLLNQGRIIAAGPVAEVLTRERLEHLFDVGFDWVNDSSGRLRLLPQSPAFPSATRMEPT